MPKRHDRLAELKRKMPDIRAEHGAHRFTALVFGFYSRCQNGACRRMKKCVGDGAPCFDAFWWDLPEIQKDIFREMVKARMAGATTAEEIQSVAFAKIMAHYTPEQIREAAAQVTAGKTAKAGACSITARPDFVTCPASG